MSNPLKSVMSFSFVALLGLALSCNSNAEPAYGKARMNKQIQTCVTEIGRRANYEYASKVTHRIATLKQKNPVETRIVIETIVHLAGAESSRDYEVSCVTDTMGKLIEFRFAAVSHDTRNGSSAVGS